MFVKLVCEDCRFVFEPEIGNVSMNKRGDLLYEHKPICPRCKSIDRALITEEGFKVLDKWFREYLKTMK